MTARIDNIVFDYCGTIINDFHNVYTASMFVLRMLGLKELNLTEFRQRFRAPYMAFYRRFTEAPKQRIDTLYLQGLRALERPKPFPGAREALEFLSEKGKSLAVLSSYPQEKLEEEIEHHGLQRFFVDVIGSVHNKAEGLSALMQRNGFLTEGTAYVGDMVYDIKVGRKVGVITIAVSWGFHSKERLLLAKPDFLIERLGLREIAGIIS